ncbi:MAG: rhodanese-like domain-containing protein [Pseudomonadota bacterium]
MDGSKITIDQIDPAGAFEALQQDPDSVLIDVRTVTEWQTIGLPDLSSIGRETICVEWVQLPDRMMNPAFLDEVRAGLGDEKPSRMFFICRSGVRSLAAAQAVANVFGTEGGPVHCTNVTEGFEGDQNYLAGTDSGKGWKARGLPWRSG